MEATNENGGGSSSGGGTNASSSRWNPTKEQLSMLEGLYDQGIRTPSAEQIQSITKKLQVYGHIEGKNVFYWFQNHKARQRQKQKMDQITNANNNNSNNVANAAVSTAYFNRFYYPSPPVSPTVVSTAAGDVSHPLFHGAPHNVAAYRPYYIPQPELGFYQHCPKMFLPNHLVNNSQSSTHLLQTYRQENIMTYASQYNASNVTTTSNNGTFSTSTFSGGSGQVTLDLFPLHPTGILQDRDHHRRSTSIGSSIEDSPPAVRTSLTTTSDIGFDMFPKMG